MQQWRDEGLILGSVRHGEQSAVVYVLTRQNGRAAGYLRGAQSSKTRPVVQPGNLVVANWQARLADQLGYFTLEPLQSLSTPLMQRAELSLVLQSVMQMLLLALPERQAYPVIFDGTKALLQTLHTNPNWAEAYVWWEVHLLSALGFGLRLEQCVQTESRDDLTHVSPKSGHAVGRETARPYADRLLKLPQFLGGAESFGTQEIPVGFALTGYFLQHYIGQPQGRNLPEARTRLGGLIARAPSTATVIPAQAGIQLDGKNENKVPSASFHRIPVRAR
jgi:DNA repair protein RecO (recombination protein O)